MRCLSTRIRIRMRRRRIKDGIIPLLAILFSGHKNKNKNKNENKK